MASPFDSLLAFSGRLAEQRDRILELRDGLVALLEQGSLGKPCFELGDLLTEDGPEHAVAVAEMMGVLALADPTVRMQASAVLAGRLYEIGVPRRVADHATPGPFAMFALVVALARKPPKGPGWAEWLWAPANGACGLQDAALVALLSGPTDVERMTFGFGQDNADLLEGLAAVRMFRSLLAAPESAEALPGRLHRGFHEALFLRGWRRHAARRAGRATATAEGEVELPAWLGWDFPDSPPGGLAAAQLEWLSAARRSRPAKRLAALRPARRAVEEFLVRCHDARMKKWGRQELSEWGQG